MVRVARRPCLERAKRASKLGLRPPRTAGSLGTILFILNRAELPDPRLGAPGVALAAAVAAVAAVVALVEEEAEGTAEPEVPVVLGLARGLERLGVILRLRASKS